MCDARLSSAGEPPVQKLAELARQFNALRARLIYFFQRNRSQDPQMLADTVLFRVLTGLLHGVEVRESLASFCAGVAKHVLQESWRRPAPEEIPDDYPAPSAVAIAGFSPAELSILIKECKRAVSPEDLRIWQRYHEEDRGHLACELGISANALRIKVFRAQRAMVAAAQRSADGE
jgi:hypothetical protein